MKLSRYEIADKSPDGALYAVVSLDNGRTFGQWIFPGTTLELDAQIQAAVDRQTAVPASTTPAPIGTVRTLTDVLAAAAPAAVPIK